MSINFISLPSSKNGGGAVYSYHTAQFSHLFRYIDKEIDHKSPILLTYNHTFVFLLDKIKVLRGFNQNFAYDTQCGLVHKLKTFLSLKFSFNFNLKCHLYIYIYIYIYVIGIHTTHMYV